MRRTAGAGALRGGSRGAAVLSRPASVYTGPRDCLLGWPAVSFPGVGAATGTAGMIVCSVCFSVFSFRTVLLHGAE